jgi:hypothetical protein
MNLSYSIPKSLTEIFSGLFPFKAFPPGIIHLNFASLSSKDISFATLLPSSDK